MTRNKQTYTTFFLAFDPGREGGELSLSNSLMQPCMLDKRSHEQPYTGRLGRMQRSTDGMSHKKSSLVRVEGDGRALFQEGSAVRDVRAVRALG